MFSRLIYPIWFPFARPIRMGHGGVISNCEFKSSMLDAGYSMLDKDLLFTTDT